MSESTRTEIAEACNAIDGINVSAYYRQGTKAGTGLVRRDRTNRPGPLGGVVTWQVVVFLPEGIAASEKWMDEKAPLLLDALAKTRTLSHPLSAEPQQLALDSGTVPVVVIQGTREEES